MIGVCCGKAVRVTQYDTTLCMQCGVERKKGLSIESKSDAHNYISHAPFFNAYSRKKRFICMLDSVLFATGHKLDEPILKYLTETTPPEKFLTSEELVKHIRKSKVKDKRYSSLHFLSKLFVANYKCPIRRDQDLRKSREHIIWMFEEVQFGHRRYFMKSNFFNYCWLLRKFLDRCDLGNYNIFVKPLKCKHRQKTYELMYSIIIQSKSLRLEWPF